jgi:signal transduction histidine kinase
MGYISISARDNQCLEEKTDREGFSDNAHYRNFRELMRRFVTFAGDAQEFLRRGWNAFKSHKAAEAIDVEPDTTPEELSASLSASLARAPGYRLALTRATLKLKEATTQAVSLQGLQGKERLSQEDVHAFQKLITVVDAASAEANGIIGQVGEYLQELSKAERLAEMLAEQVEQLKDQMRQMHEVIALGLTAESLSHEVKNITAGLADRNDQILRYLRSSGGRDSRIISYAEFVKSTVAALRKQLSYLAPSLQYVRETREEFDLYDLLSELLKHHFSRFSSERISLRINRSGVDEFRVRVNRGKMIQIFDNIFLNSEYWLMEDMRLNRIAHGTIEVNLKPPLVLISDNGRGVDEKLEETLFEPFISGKGKGTGRGLGLFIVQQLLLSEGASVILQEERNKFDRRFVFELNLRGMCVG